MSQRLLVTLSLVAVQLSVSDQREIGVSPYPNREGRAPAMDHALVESFCEVIQKKFRFRFTKYTSNFAHKVFP